MPQTQVDPVLVLWRLFPRAPASRCPASVPRPQVWPLFWLPLCPVASDSVLNAKPKPPLQDTFVSKSLIGWLLLGSLDQGLADDIDAENLMTNKGT